MWITPLAQMRVARNTYIGCGGCWRRRRISDIIHEGTTLDGRTAFPAVRHSTRIERIDNYLVSKLFICRNKTWLLYRGIWRRVLNLIFWIIKYVHTEKHHSIAKKNNYSFYFSSFKLQLLSIKNIFSLIVLKCIKMYYLKF